MSRAILLLATLLAIPLGASLDGQTTGALESELVGRIDSLSAILHRADSVARIADADRKEEQERLLAGRLDTLQVGPFFVVTPVRQVRLARRYFERAWERYAAVVGTGPTSIEGRVFLFGRSEAFRGLATTGQRISTRYLSSDRDRAIGRILGTNMNNSFPQDLWTWVGGFLISADPERELEQAYPSLATTASAAVTDCYDGALDRCWDAMGLDHQDEWATAWYNASERRSLVGRSHSSAFPGARASCVDENRDDACMAALLNQGMEASIPLPTRARMTLLAHALSLGGPEGYRRLATGRDPMTRSDARPVPDADAPLKDRLVDASGVSADSLMASWRAATFAARPDVHGDTKRLRWSSLFWLVVLAGISTRSTRWRLT